MIKYSIVIPTYNNRTMLNNTLEALNHQSGLDSDTSYEVIVVDDGSSEDTLSYIEGTPRTYPFRFIYLDRTPDSCRSKVRNAGWRCADGQYIIFLDSDMIVAPNYLQELERAYKLDPDLFVFSYRYMLIDEVDTEDIRSGRLFQKNYRALEYLEARYFDGLITSFNNTALGLPWMPVYSCSMALPKEQLVEIDGFNESYKGWGVEDWDVAYKCHKLGTKIVSHLNMTALHQYHGEVFGDLRTLQKMIDWDRNISVMYRLHKPLKKELNRLSMNIAYFRGKAPYLPMRKGGPSKITHEFTFSHMEELPHLKNKLEALSAEPNRLIQVWDAIGSTELHIWIQLLGFTTSEIRYIPTDLLLDQEEVRQYFQRVFTWRKKLIMSYRSLALLCSKLVSALSLQKPTSIDQ